MELSDLTNKIFEALEDAAPGVYPDIHFWCWHGSVQLELKETKYNPDTNVLEIIFVDKDAI